MLEQNPSSLSEQRARVERELFLRAMSPAKPPAEAARQIAQGLKDLFLKAGDVVFRRGDAPRAAAFVVRGELVYQGIDDEDDQSFGPGALIGILDLNIGRPRARTCVAKSDCHLLELDYEAWLEVLDDHPDFAAQARRNVSGTMHDLMLQLGRGGGFEELFAKEEEEGRKTAGDPEADVTALIAMLRRTRHFETTSVHALAQIVKRSEVLRPELGELVLRPGEARDRLFFVVSGAVTIERRVAPDLVARFGPGKLVLAGAAFSNALGKYAMTAGAGASLLVIDHVDLDDVADDHFDVVRSVLRGISLDRDFLQSLKARSEAKSRRR